jgi:hypothetical protein
VRRLGDGFLDGRRVVKSADDYSPAEIARQVRKILDGNDALREALAKAIRARRPVVDDEDGMGDGEQNARGVAAKDMWRVTFGPKKGENPPGMISGHPVLQPTLDDEDEDEGAKALRLAHQKMKSRPAVDRHMRISRSLPPARIL